MADTEMETDGSGPTPDEKRPRRRWIRGTLVGILLVALGFASGTAVGVHRAAAWFWHGMEHHRFDPQQAAARVDRGVERALSNVNATTEQETKVSEIAKSAVTDLAALGVDPWTTRGKFVDLLRADTVDPAALEALRAEQVAKMDAASKRIVQAMTEAAQVLTPEQRRELTDHWSERYPR